MTHYTPLELHKLHVMHARAAPSLDDLAASFPQRSPQAVARKARELGLHRNLPNKWQRIAKNYLNRRKD